MADKGFEALSFDGEVAVITGAGSGIGAATAKLLAARGAKVAVADVVTTAAQTVADAIAAEGGQATAFELDVREEASVERCFARINETFGRLDVAVNCAGIAGPHCGLEEIEVADFDSVIGVNLRGVWLSMREEIVRLRARDGGRIVNVASILALRGLSGSASYVAAKHGVLGLTRNGALELASAGIRVNAVCPGVIDTPMFSSLSFTDDLITNLAVLHPLDRLGDPAEVAEGIAWLCSRASSFTTGAALTIDGGWHVR